MKLDKILKNLLDIAKQYNNGTFIGNCYTYHDSYTISDGLTTKGSKSLYKNI